MELRKWAIALGCVMVLGPAAAMAETPDGQMGNDSGKQAGGGGCHQMMDAADAAGGAIQDGATVSMEETHDGAVVRFRAPNGDDGTIQESRQAAQQLAQAARQAGAQPMGQSCGCPGAEGETLNPSGL